MKKIVEFSRGDLVRIVRSNTAHYVGQVARVTVRTANGLYRLRPEGDGARILGDWHSDALTLVEREAEGFTNYTA